MESECQRIEPMLAAYALDALEIDEKLQVEAHLETCPACQEILTQYQAVSNGLMAASPPVQPSRRVRENVLAQTAPASQKIDWADLWRIFFTRMIPAGALLGVLLLLVFNINLFRSTKQMLETQEALVRQNQTNQTALALLTYPDAQVAIIEDENIYGTLVYDPGGQLAVLNVWGLKPLSEGEAYQVWLIEPDQTRISGGVFSTPDQKGFTSFEIEAPTPIDSFIGIGVTIEPQGGSPGPTGPRIFGIEL
jgi:anti-sigma-K factor RskA